MHKIHFLLSPRVILRGAWGRLKESGGSFIIIKLWVSEYLRSFFSSWCDHIIGIADTLKEGGVLILINLWVGEYHREGFHIILAC